MTEKFAFALGEIVIIGGYGPIGAAALRGKVIGQTRYLGGGIAYVVSTWTRERGVSHETVGEYDLAPVPGGGR